MSHKITVFGAGLDAQTMVADLTLAGFEVNMLTLPDQNKHIEDSVKENDGIYLEGDKTISGITGYAVPKMITSNAKKAIKDADIIIFTHPTSDYEERMKYISPYLEKGQIINFNTYGYWPSLRVKKFLKKDITLTETSAPIYWPAGGTGHVKPLYIRNQVPVAAFPSNKNEQAFRVLKGIFPQFNMAKNIIQTNLENINLMVHTPIVLLNIGWFDRSEKIGFYETGNTFHTGLLMEILDKERLKICEAFGVRALPIDKYVKQLYNSKGDNIYEVILNCEPYQSWGKIPANSWIGMCQVDVPHSIVPAAQLADVAGIQIPLTKSIITLTGGILKTNFWETGFTLKKLKLSNLSLDGIKNYVKTGTRS
jgi:opine dehydrogenase